MEEGPGTRLARVEATLDRLRAQVRDLHHDIYDPQVGLAAGVADLRRLMARLLWQGWALIVAFLGTALAVLLHH
jgi:hypothetical protein